MQAVRDAGLRRLSGATVALTVTSLAGVGVVAAVVKSATEHSAHRSAPSSATTETGQPDTSQPGGSGQRLGQRLGSTGSGGSGLVPDQSGSRPNPAARLRPAPVPATASRTPPREGR